MVTSLEVGTTTMRFGLTRYGPVAPVACQRGKYEILTNTGTPTRLTWNEIDCSPTLTSLTVTLGSEVFMSIVEMLVAGGQFDGPVVAATVPHSFGFSHQVVFAWSHPTRLVVLATTFGMLESPTTIGPEAIL